MYCDANSAPSEQSTKYPGDFMGTFFLYSLVNKSRACDQGVEGKDENGGLTVVAVGERGGQKSEERGL